MSIRILYEDGTYLELVAVQAITETNYNTVTLNTFGNGSVVHRKVSRIEVFLESK